MAETMKIMNTRFHFADSRYCHVEPMHLDLSIELQDAEVSVKDFPEKQRKAFNNALSATVSKWEKIKNDFMSDIEKSMRTIDGEVEKEISKQKNLPEDDVGAFAQRLADAKLAGLQTRITRHTEAFKTLSADYFSNGVRDAIEASYAAMKQKRKNAKIKLGVKLALLGGACLILKGVQTAVKAIPTVGKVASAGVGVLASKLQDASLALATDLLKSGDMARATLNLLKESTGKITNAIASIENIEPGFFSDTPKFMKFTAKLKTAADEISATSSDIYKNYGLLDKYIAKCNQMVRDGTAMLKTLDAKGDTDEKTKKLKNKLGNDIEVAKKLKELIEKGRDDAKAAVAEYMKKFKPTFELLTKIAGTKDFIAQKRDIPITSQLKRLAKATKDIVSGTK